MSDEFMTVGPDKPRPGAHPDTSLPGETPDDKHRREDQEKREQEKKSKEHEKKAGKKGKSRTRAEGREGEELDTGDLIAVYEFQEILGHPYIVKLFGPEPSHGPGETLDRLGVSAKSYPIGSYIAVHGPSFESEIPEGVLEKMAAAAEREDEQEAVPYADPRPAPEAQIEEEKAKAEEVEERGDREQDRDRDKRHPRSEQLPAEPPPHTSTKPASRSY